MKKTKTGILILVILLAVGFAAVSTTLIINGTAIFGTNEDDFDVIFTKSIIDGVDVSESTISEDGKTLTFETGELAIKDDESVLNFTVKNNSTQYDANVTMECIAEGENASEYYEIINTIPEVIEAQTSKDGSVTARLKKSSVNEITETFACTITATAVERDTVGEEPLTWTWEDSNNSTAVDVGDEIVLGNETFNVISTAEDTISILAQYNLGTDYRQSTTNNYVTFSEINGWEYTPGPKEIDIQSYEGNVKTYVNEYVSYLQNETEDTTITGNLITLSELKELGCTIIDDYSYTSELTCANSSNASWLVNGQYWWTHSASSTYDYGVWYVYPDGSLTHNHYNNLSEVRPVITISTELIDAPVCTTSNPTTICNEEGDICWIDSDCSVTRNIGDIVTLGNEATASKEQFYILNADEQNIQMMSMYNLEVGNSTNSSYPPTVETGIQTPKGIGRNNQGIDIYATIAFSSDAQKGTNYSDYEGSIVEGYVNNYSTYLANTLGVENTATLISKEELEALGCNATNKVCTGAPAFIYSTSYWTRTADNVNNIWDVASTDVFGISGYYFDDYFGVRPVITISSDILE